MIDICNCNCNNEIAYIDGNSVSIKNYLENYDLYKNKKIYCQNDKEMIKYKSFIKRSHFRHKENNPMSEWHKEWQDNFNEIEIQIGNCRADAIIGNIILEFQHSPISMDNVKIRNDNYTENNKILNWIINGNDIIVEKLITNNYLLIFNTEWKYRNFLNNDYIYLDILDTDDNIDYIYKIIPINVKSNMIELNERYTKDEFIDSIKNNVSIWKNINDFEQCTLYHNQRGAGCGKTYESIQLLNNYDKFNHKTIFIYLTKMHSAKDVIKNEFNDQYKKNKINNISVLIDNENYSNPTEQPKQYKITYNDSNKKCKCTLIIGTIDSFMYSICDKTKTNDDKDYFKGIVKNIKDGHMSVGTCGNIRYTSENIKLNKKCLIIIDEAQDLETDYVKAICSIMRNTYIDTYIIGDKLQSILYEHNIHTYLENNELPNIYIEKNIGSNIIKRFHNKKFKKFVNNIVDYEKYNLEKIKNICDGSCSYCHNNKKIPYKLFEIPKIYSSETDKKK